MLVHVDRQIFIDKLVTLCVARLEEQVGELEREMRSRLDLVERHLTDIIDLAHKIHARIQSNQYTLPLKVRGEGEFAHFTGGFSAANWAAPGSNCLVFCTVRHLFFVFSSFFCQKSMLDKKKTARDSYKFDASIYSYNKQNRIKSALLSCQLKITILV